MVDEIPVETASDTNVGMSDEDIWSELDSADAPSEGQIESSQVEGEDEIQGDPVPDESDPSPDNPSQGEDVQESESSDADDQVAKALEEDLADIGDEADDEAVSDQEAEDDALAKSQAQIENTKKRMHEATMEAAELRRRDSEREAQFQQMQEKLDSLQSSIDSGEAKTSSQSRLDAVMDNLSDDQKETMELYPELMDVVLAITSGKGPSKDSSNEKSEEDSLKTGESEAARNWHESVMELDPNFMELVNTDEWGQYTKECHRTVRSVMETYDQWDARGAKSLYSGFNAWKTRKAKAGGAKSVRTPKSGSVSNPRRKAAPAVSREQEESEIWAEIAKG